MFGFFASPRPYMKEGTRYWPLIETKDLVQKMKDYCTRRSIGPDATDKDTLMALNVHDADFAVVGLGTRLDHSVFGYATLKRAGRKKRLS